MCKSILFQVPFPTLDFQLLQRSALHRVVPLSSIARFTFFLNHHHPLPNRLYHYHGSVVLLPATTCGWWSRVSSSREPLRISSRKWLGLIQSTKFIAFSCKFGARFIPAAASSGQKYSQSVHLNPSLVELFFSEEAPEIAP